MLDGLAVYADLAYMGRSLSIVFPLDGIENTNSAVLPVYSKACTSNHYPHAYLQEVSNITLYDISTVYYSKTQGLVDHHAQSGHKP